MHTQLLQSLIEDHFIVYPSSILPQAGDLVEFLGSMYRVWKRDVHGNVYLSSPVQTACVRIERFRRTTLGHYRLA